jgi:hypothetical protein
MMVRQHDYISRDEPHIWRVYNLGESPSLCHQMKAQQPLGSRR